MKLWHDDVRPAPHGWVWVQNNDDAKAILLACSEIITDMSLDHDLGAIPYQEVGIMARGRDEETGYKLAYWMAQNAYTGVITLPETITVHSWNPAGAAKMVSVFLQVGHTNVKAVPFDPVALGIGTNYII